MKMSKEENIDCTLCKKLYEYEIERTITLLEDGIGMEYVVCEKCYNKVNDFIKKMKK